MEALSWRFPSEDFTGTFVEHFLIGAELLVGDGGKVGAFGQIVADSAILAFAGATLPTAMGMTEENLEAEVGGEGLMLGHLLALVVSETQAELSGDVDEAASERLTNASRVFCGQVAKHRVAGGPFNEHANRRPVAFASNQVAFVVTGNQTGFNLCGTLVHQHHVRDIALRCFHAPAVGLPGAVATPQASDQFTLKFADRDDVNITIDRLVGGLHGRQFRVLEFKRARDFLRRPASPESRMHFVAQRRVGGYITPTALTGSASGQRAPMGFGRTVDRPASVALNLQADRARRTIQSRRQGGLSISGTQPRLQFDAFRQIKVRAHPAALRASRHGGKLRNRQATAEPVPCRLRSFKGSRTGLTTGCFWFSTLRTWVQIRHSRSVLSAPKIHKTPRARGSHFGGVGLPPFASSRLCVHKVSFT